jgi:hypothetical protein
MEYTGKTNQLIIDLDEAKWLAKQSPTWENSLKNRKIALAQAALKLIEAACDEPQLATRILYKENCDI